MGNDLEGLLGLLFSQILSSGLLKYLLVAFCLGVLPDNRFYLFDGNVQETLIEWLLEGN